MLFISLSIFILIGMFIPFTLKFIDQNFKNIFKNLDIILNFEINNLNYFLILISSMFFFLYGFLVLVAGKMGFSWERVYLLWQVVCIILSKQDISLKKWNCLSKKNTILR